MKKKRGSIAAIVMLVLSTWMVHAADKKGPIDAGPEQTVSAPVISEAWARATVPGQPVGGAYLKIRSIVPLTLVRIESDAAKIVQVHTMQMDNGVMKMREHGPLDIPAEKTVELKPGGLHLMLLGLKQALKAGDSILLKVTFVNANHVETTTVVNAEVRQIGQPAKGS